MYHNYISARINERADNTKLVKKIAAEKSKIEKKYNTLVEVKKMLDDDEKRAMKENLAQTKNNTSTVEKELGETKRKQLKDEIHMLKQVQKTRSYQYTNV
ncbi:hypothetical protein QYE76_045279 [Lolium multiflorum]|uniref:Uncharacterized protein n=1 Tax=Lolium multiflorum TaxID=4521 RepID=A0AAD8TMP9_LOLMU|nr:hypothetical protein QYE76_045279 [Lolium multiflorum]